MTRSILRRRPHFPPVQLAALALACLALFVALGGTSYAAKLLIGPKQIKNNAVTTKKIKNGHVRSADVANGGVQLVDLSGPLQAQIEDSFELLDGSVTTAKLANDAVTSPKVAANSLGAADLAPNSVGSSEVAPNSVGSGDIGSSAINGSELAGNAVQGDEVQNGSLDAVDVGRFSGSANANFPGVAANSCNFAIIDPTPGAETIEGSASTVTPGAGYGGNVSFHWEAEAGTLRLKACNPTGVPVDPDGPGGTNYNYIVFG